MTARRILRVGATLAVVGSLLAPARPAAARPQGDIAIKVGDRITKTYTQIPANNPQGALFSAPGPEDCKTSQYCDTILVKINRRPDFNFNLDDDQISIVLSWYSEDIKNSAQNVQSNDIDMYIWSTDPDAEEDYTHAATADNPEALSLVSYPGDAFYIVLVNFSGANTGYTINMRYDDVVYDIPPESFDPDEVPVDRSGAPTGASGGSGPSRPPSKGGAGGSAPSSTAPSGAPASTPGIDLAAIGSSDLDTVGSGGRLEDALAAQGKLAGVKRSGPLTPLPNPASWQVLMWLVVLPILAAGLLTGVVMRRRPSALRG